MPKTSFRDPVSNVLKAWGYVSVNTPGDLARSEPDEFSLDPGKWQWDGIQWVPFVSPPLTPAQQLAGDTSPKWIRTLLVYLGQIQVPTKTPTQVLSDLLTIYQGLP